MHLACQEPGTPIPIRDLAELKEPPLAIAPAPPIPRPSAMGPEGASEEAAPAVSSVSDTAGPEDEQRPWLRWSEDLGVHWLPVRSSWLNQVEIFFSMLQTQALTPNNFPSLADLSARILDYIALRNWKPKPINWSYTSDDLRKQFDKTPPAPTAADSAPPALASACSVDN